MKNKLKILMMIMLLSGCKLNIVDDSSNKNSHSTSSDISSDSSVNNKVTSSSNNNSSSNVISSISSSIKDSSDKIEDVVVETKKKYTSHPLSEPEVNKQLLTFNPMGNLSETWNYYRGDNVTVAVIDSGFDYDHPEFIDEFGNSRVSDKSCYIYTTNNITKVEVGKTKVNITDGDSHGTMCAGLLGASVNGKGISGIAPNVDLMLIKIDKQALSMAEAFKYAADNGAKVISTSLGAYPNANGESSGDIHFPRGFDLKTAFNENINYAYSKGVTIVAATGNSRTTTLSYPAGCDNVIGAGGLNYGSQTAIWDNGYEGSNYNGSQVYVDVFAPSDGIYAPGFDTSTNSPTYWGDAKGTSFAAPLIAGAIAMYFQKYPTHTNNDVLEALKRTCVNISSYNNNKNMGYGRLDVGKLLNIDEDIENKVINPTTSISQKATKLTIEDEAGWNFRTLHLYGLTFEKGYGYYEFEQYLEHVYGKRAKTSTYQKEGTTKCYAYTDEDYVGDYYLCNGNKADGVATSYEYIFPWWVKGAYYQIVNNHNWLPEGGKSFSSSNGYGKNITSYFWTNSSSFGIEQVVYDNCNVNMSAVKITKNLVNNKQEVLNTSNESISIFDYYLPSNPSYNDLTFKGWYLDSELKIPYTKQILKEDTILYGLMA